MIERNAVSRGDRIAVTHCESGFEMLGPFVPKHDAENVVVNEFLDALRYAAQQFFAIEDGSDFAADFVKQRQRVGLLGIRHEETSGDGISVAHKRKWREFGSFIHGPGTWNLQQ